MTAVQMGLTIAVCTAATMLTGGAPLTAQFPPEVAVRTEAVEAILSLIHI